MKDLPMLSNMFSRTGLFLGLKIVALVTAILAVFQQDLVIVVIDALRSESMSYIVAIPFLFMYLLYRKRKMLRAVIGIENQDQPRVTRSIPTIAGILLSITAILLYWYGSYTFTPLEHHMVALPIFAAGLILVFFNTQTLRQLAFSVAFLIFLVPLPLEVIYSLGSTLSVISSTVSYNVVSWLGIPSTIINEYGNPTIQITRAGGEVVSFSVDIACSGIYSLIGFLVFAVFIAYLIRDKPWKKLTLFLIGFSLVYLLNITRITTILIIGYQYGEQTALQLFHLLGGWILIFIGTFFLLVLAEKALHIQIFAKSKQGCTACDTKNETNHGFCLVCGKILRSAPIRFHKTEIIKLAGVIASVILLVSIQAPVFALTEGPAQIIIQTPQGEQGNTKLLPEIQGYTLDYVYRDKDFEKISGQDASLVYSYVPLEESKQTIWVAIEIGSATAMLHRWEVCLISWMIHLEKPVLATQLDLKDVQILQNPPIIARYFAFQWVNTNQTQVVLYWYENAIFKASNSTPQQKQVKISLMTYPETLRDLTRVEELSPFAVAVAQYWQPIKTWTEIMLLLSQQSIYLAMITGAMLLFFIVFHAHTRRKQAKANVQAYQKLSTPNKRIIDMTIETEKTTIPTLQAIASKYKDKTGELVGNERLLQRLFEAEKTGILRNDIGNVQDHPTKIWKSQLKLLGRHPQKKTNHTNGE
jgi:exosortase